MTYLPVEILKVVKMSSVVSSLVSPENNLKLFISTSLSEIIRLLEGLTHDQSEFDYVLYKLEQVVQVGVRSEEQELWQQVFPEQLLYTLIEAYNRLLEENSPSLAVISASRDPQRLIMDLLVVQHLTYCTKSNVQDVPNL